MTSGVRLGNGSAAAVVFAGDLPLDLVEPAVEKGLGSLSNLAVDDCEDAGVEVWPICS